MSHEVHVKRVRSQHFHAAQMAKVKRPSSTLRLRPKVHHLKAWKQWKDLRTKGQKELASLQELIDEALEEAQQRAEEEFKEKVYEVQKTVDNVKQQLKSMLDSLPPQWAELAEWDLIMARLQSQREKQNQSTFARGSGMVGKQKSEMQLGEVKRWVSRVDSKVGSIAPKLAAIGDTEDDGSADANGGGGQNKQSSGEAAEVHGVAAVEGAPQQASAETDPAKLTFHYVCDDVRRKKRRGEPVEPQDVELVADRAFVLIKELRNELAPSWKPEDVPRWLNAGDKYVYDMALSSVPKELFEQTNGWDGIQDLRKQQQVFTLRAADQTSESARRVTAKAP